MASARPPVIAVGLDGPVVHDSEVVPRAELANERLGNAHRCANAEAGVLEHAERRVLAARVSSPREAIGVEPLGIVEHGRVTMGFLHADPYVPALWHDKAVEVELLDSPTGDVLAL